MPKYLALSKFSLEEVEVLYSNLQYSFVQLGQQKLTVPNAFVLDTKEDARMQIVASLEEARSQHEKSITQINEKIKEVMAL